MFKKTIKILSLVLLLNPFSNVYATEVFNIGVSDDGRYNQDVTISFESGSVLRWKNMSGYCYHMHIRLISNT